MKNSKYVIKLNHPVFGELDGWVYINPFSAKRSEVEAELLERDLSSIQDSMYSNASVVSSVIVDWDEAFFGVPFSYETACELLSVAHYSFITRQIADAISSADAEFAEAISQTLESIEKFWQGNRKIGKETKSTLYKKLQKDYHKLPDNLKKRFDEMKAENGHLLEDKVFLPPKILLKAYTSYFSIRNTKTLDSYITHSDIMAFMSITNKKLNPYEIDAMLRMDRTFVKCYHESNKNDK